jgi:hypothetical protein
MSEFDVYLFRELKTNCNKFENELINDLINKKYCKILNNELVRLLLSSIDLPLNDSNLSTIESKLNIKRDLILRIIYYSGISSLQLYVCDNFLSFIKNDPNFDNCIEFINNLFNNNNNYMNYSIDSDGERVHSIARSVSLLKLSRFAFMSTKSLTEDKLFYILWRMRSAIVLQISLTVPSNSIYNEIISYVLKIEEIFKDNENLKIDSELKIESYNEMLSALLWFGDIERVKTISDCAQQISGLTITLSGALGVRTQFQQKPVSQLIVKIDRIENFEQQLSESKPMSVEENGENSDLPKNVALNDDTLLQKIKFLSTDDENQNIILSKAEQSLILSLVKSAHRIGSSSDELLNEELLSYLDFLIGNSKLWSILYHCLFLRSLLEKDSRRRVERSMTQINELVDIVRDSNCDSTQIINRFDNFYSVLPNPFWITEKYLANILISLGVTKSALEIYLRLHLWEDVIECYQRYD